MILDAQTKVRTALNYPLGLIVNDTVECSVPRGMTYHRVQVCLGDITKQVPIWLKGERGGDEIIRVPIHSGYGPSNLIAFWTRQENALTSPRNTYEPAVSVTQTGAAGVPLTCTAFEGQTTVDRWYVHSEVPFGWTDLYYYISYIVLLAHFSRKPLKPQHGSDPFWD